MMTDYYGRRSYHPVGTPGTPADTKGTSGTTAPDAGHASKVLLVGMPGSGKSSVAPLLAPRLGWGYVDTDAQIEKIAGLSVAGIFARHGEEYFRAQESRCLRWVLGISEGVIVAVGGGAVLDPENRRLIKEGGIVVWLRASVPTLVAHLGSATGRPLLAEGDLRTSVANLDAQRRLLYQEIATVTLDVDDGDVDKVVDRVLRSLGRVGRR